MIPLKSWELHHLLPQNFILIRQQKLVLIVQNSNPYKAGTIVSKNSPAYWDTTKEPTKTQYELFLKHDSFGEAEYRELCDYTHAKGMDFTSTPFDYASADYLEDMVEFYKISSSDLSNSSIYSSYWFERIEPVYMSVGAADLSEVDVANKSVEGSWM